MKSLFRGRKHHPLRLDTPKEDSKLVQGDVLGSPLSPHPDDTTPVGVHQIMKVRKESREEAERRRSSLTNLQNIQRKSSREELVNVHKHVAAEEERLARYIANVHLILQKLYNSYEVATETCPFCSISDMEVMIQEAIREHTILSARQFDEVDPDAADHKPGTPQRKISTLEVFRKVSVAAHKLKFYEDASSGDLKKGIMEKEESLADKQQRAKELDATMETLVDNYLVVRNYCFVTRYRHLRRVIEEATRDCLKE